MKSPLIRPSFRSALSICRFLAVGLLLFCSLHSVNAIPGMGFGGARFNFFNDFGCHQSPGGQGALNSSVSGAGGNAATCMTCQTAGGMPRWWVDEPYISMHVVDEPLSYTLSSGQDMEFRMFYKQNFTIPAPDQVPGFYNTPNGYSSRTSDGSTVIPYLNGWRGYGGTNGYYGGMTNAAWMNNWQEYIVLWDYSWEVAYYAHAHGQPQSPPAVFNSRYEAMAFMPNGGVYYFTSNATNETLNPQTQLSNGVSQVQLSSFPANHPTPTNAPVADGNGIYWGSGNTNGVKLTYPDGSQDVFGLNWWNGNTSGGLSTAAALLTEKIDPQGRVTKLGYVKISITNACSTGRQIMYVLTNVVDIDGRTNRFIYSTSAPGGGALLTEIDDPFGRKATFNYQGCVNFSGYPANPGWLTSIVDSQGLSTAFKYGSIGFSVLPAGDLAHIITPYGTNSFSYENFMNADAPTNFDMRATYVTEPDGAEQLFAYFHDATNEVPNTLTAPGGVPGGWVFDDGTTGDIGDPLCLRNSFCWGRAQMANITTSGVLTELNSGNPGLAISNMTAGDLSKARQKHWLLDQDGASVTETLSSEQDPSPDAAGAIAGERTWYAYTNVTGAANYMARSQVGAVAQTLPDSTSKFTLFHYYPSGLVATNTSSYTQPDGSVGTFAKRFIYGNGNAIDLTVVSNSLGQSNVMTYNNHQLITSTDPAGEVTIFGWDATSYNLVGVQYANGQTMSLSYYPATTGGHITNTSSFISSVTVWPQNLSDSYTDYTNSVPRIVHVAGTGLPDLWSTNTVDGLNRLTGTAFADGTSLSNIYSNLDLTGRKDRLGNWTYYAYDRLQHLTNVTDALSNKTAFTWCSCGSLTSTSNMLGNVTHLNYDNQSRLTNIVYADLSSKNWQFDLLGRATSISDGLGNSQTLAYNNQSHVIAANNIYGQQLFGAYYDAVGRPLSTTNANGVVITNGFDLANRLTTQVWPLGGTNFYGWTTNGLMATTNQDGHWTVFGRDNAGRLTAVTNAVQTNLFAYNALDEMTSLTDGLHRTTTWGFNQFGWMTNKINALGVTILTNGYDADGRLTSRWMMGTNTTYQYDAVANLTKIIYPATNVVFKYDAIHELTNMVDISGVTSWTWTASGQLASETGPWTSDTITYGYTQGHRTSVSLSQPSNSWNATYGYDSAWRMNDISSPAGNFGYSYPSGSNQYLVGGIVLPNGATIANSYDGLGRLTGTALTDHWGHVLDGYTYGVDLMGLRTNMSRQLGLSGNNVSIGYDAISQITNWTGRETSGAYRQNEQLSYAYDGAGNLHTRTNYALVQTFAVDQLNQLSNVTYTGTFTVSGSLPASPGSVTVNTVTAQTNGDFTFAASGFMLTGGTNIFTIVADDIHGSNITTSVVSANLPSLVSPQYDPNGNLISDGTRTFQYDAENQLTNVYATNAWRIGFVYDGLNRKRQEIDYTWSGGWQPTNGINYLYDGNSVIQERTTNNVVTVTYTRGLDLSGSVGGAGGIGGLLARTDTNGNLFYHADGSGNVTALMDGNERVTARYEYDPFGRMLGMWGTNAPVNRYRFSSKEYSAASGLYYFGSRFYDPSVQRWINRDPTGEVGGMNLYGFVGNSPLNVVDPLGQNWFTTQINNFETSAAQVGQGIYDYAMGDVTGPAPGTYAALRSEELGGIDPHNNIVRDAFGMIAQDVANQAVGLGVGAVVGPYLGLAIDMGCTGVANGLSDLTGLALDDAAGSALGEGLGSEIGEGASRATPEEMWAAAQAQARGILNATYSEFGASDLAYNMAPSTAPPVWPSTVQEMTDFLGVEGRSIPDTAATPGRGKVVWELGPTKITYEQHPYHPNAPAWHSGPHWHLDTPGAPHVRYGAGDAIPGF